MAIITVTSTADSGAGSLRAAVTAAGSDDTIRFAPALANQTISLNSRVEIAPGKNLTLDGMGAANLKISGQNKTQILFVNSNVDFNTNVTIKNLAFENGYTASQGGAILVENKGSLTLESVRFKNNVADQGGGAIFSLWDTNLTVLNSQFDGNKAVAGNNERGAGAIAFVSPGLFTIRNSRFTNNEGINGGAVNSLNGKLTIENSQFINNRTTAARFATGQPRPDLRGYGGALFTDRASSTSEASGAIRIVGTLFEGNQGLAEGGGAYLYTGTQDSVTIEATSFQNNQVAALAGGNGGNGGGLVVLSNGDNRGLTLNRTAFVNNSATSQGGGLWIFDTPTAITNSTFSGNRALVSETPAANDFNRNGGGITAYGAPLNITNSTLANNRAGWVGGGITAANDAPVTLTNTIFANNSALNGGNPWNIQQHTNRQFIDGGGNIQFPQANDDRISANSRVADPKLGALQDNGGGLLTHALLSGSPAINSAVAGAPATDARGLGRVGQADVGAFEFGATAANSGGSGGSSGSGSISGTNGNDDLIGTAGRDQLTGGLGADRLTGGLGADWFLYRGATQRAALAGSQLNRLDQITDFNVIAGDRIQLDYDNNLATAQRPKALFNAGVVTGQNLAAAVRSAYADKNQKQQGKQQLSTNEAVLLDWRGGSYLSVNDSAQAFGAKRDLLINATGLVRPDAQSSAGVIAVNAYFQ
ncbi:MAG: hypothetical protein KME07_19685 [Pegethrix bostrychoides GSE-TBD4-15B]|jgi:predicted outer membrane repeat protein|uniref:Calcium-binding protein n=1 Tax=Pegethrix bostrychoides GSE-TBD4-15B TaxID=2839662 RepID=A0A951U685_9CYAN|nr:hypothetical protein [Pegethrix bostrychoides GSE-TBD4-15B]